MTTFQVPDMTCNHCAAAIKQAVKARDTDAIVDVQVVEQRVNIDSKLTVAKCAQAIEVAGYTPVLV